MKKSVARRYSRCCDYGYRKLRVPNYQSYMDNFYSTHNLSSHFSTIFPSFSQSPRWTFSKDFHFKTL